MLCLPEHKINLHFTLISLLSNSRGWSRSSVPQTSLQMADLNGMKNSEGIPWTWSTRQELPGIIYHGCALIHCRRSVLQACSMFWNHHPAGKPCYPASSAHPARSTRRNSLWSPTSALPADSARLVSVGFKVFSKTCRNSLRFCSFQEKFLALANPVRLSSMIVKSRVFNPVVVELMKRNWGREWMEQNDPRAPVVWDLNKQCPIW